MKSFQETQLAFARHLRAPEQNPAPEGIEDRRMGIYRDLIYNNIENFIANVFPVMRSIMGDENWHKLIRAFISAHRCQTPYFVELSEEFLQYLAQGRGLQEGDPSFLLELAHYEWIELALDTSDALIPPASPAPANLLASKPRVSPLVACLNYQYPVHRVSPGYQPSTPEPTQLVVYRNRADRVRFMAANTMTLRLLYLLQTNTSASLGDQLQLIAAELQHTDPERLFSEARLLVEELAGLDILSHFE
jgi:hypothetical protein